MNEGDSKSKIKKVKGGCTSIQKDDAIVIIQRYLSYVGDVLSSAWIRYAIPSYYGNDGFLLGCRRSFLLYFRILLVGVYFAYETLK